IEQLETADAQIKLFSSFPEKLQEQLLQTTLLDARRARETLDGMFAAWRSGNPEAMEAVITREVRADPSLEAVLEKLLYERNDTMTQKIEQYLHTPKVYFIAVGAGHLVGKRGIVSQLRDKKFAIEQP